MLGKGRVAVRLGDIRLDDVGHRQRLLREAGAAQAAFEASITEDFGNAMTRFLEWTDAMGRVNALSSGGATFVDIPNFSEMVTRIAYQEAIRRRA